MKLESISATKIMTNLKNSRMGLNRKARVNRSKVDKASAWCVAIVLWVLCSSAAQVGEMKELNDSVCSNDDYWGNIDENPKTFMGQLSYKHFWSDWNFIKQNLGNF